MNFIKHQEEEDTGKIARFTEEIKSAYQTWEVVRYL
jgi:hypothetical protein